MDKSVISRIEAVYHRLSSDPERGAEELERIYWKWQRSGRQEPIQALGTVLEELNGFPLSDLAQGRVLFILGWIRLGRLPLAQSEESAGRALEMLERTGPAASCAEARALLGQVLQQRGQLAAALAEYRASKRIMEGLTALNPANTDWQRELSVSHNKIGESLRDARETGGGAGRVSGGQRIMEGLTALDPANTYWQRELAVPHANIGSVYQAEGKLEEAQAEYQEAKRIMGGTHRARPRQHRLAARVVGVA